MFGRPVPVTWWSYPVLVFTAVLSFLDWNLVSPDIEFAGPDSRYGPGDAGRTFLRNAIRDAKAKGLRPKGTIRLFEPGGAA